MANTLLVLDAFNFATTGFLNFHEQTMVPSLSSAQYESSKHQRICLFLNGADPCFPISGKGIKGVDEEHHQSKKVFFVVSVAVLPLLPSPLAEVRTGPLGTSDVPSKGLSQPLTILP